MDRGRAKETESFRRIGKSTGVNVQRAKCLALICTDPDAPGGGGIYSLAGMEY